MVKQKNDIYEEAINSILNSKFEAPGWPRWGFLKDLPEFPKDENRHNEDHLPEKRSPSGLDSK
ncbi:hypothetical protein [Sulfurisphaera ohwakuensis]|uniref:hypothetical protein n=1 Tax=Sulfurisphaera ohwakuensis TaxID=69656 RepID=UPI0036F3E38E